MFTLALIVVTICLFLLDNYFYKEALDVGFKVRVLETRLRDREALIIHLLTTKDKGSFGQGFWMKIPVIGQALHLRQLKQRQSELEASLRYSRIRYVVNFLLDVTIVGLVIGCLFIGYMTVVGCQRETPVGDDPPHWLSEKRLTMVMVKTKNGSWQFATATVFVTITWEERGGEVMPDGEALEYYVEELTKWLTWSRLSGQDGCLKNIDEFTKNYFAQYHPRVAQVQLILLRRKWAVYFNRLMHPVANLSPYFEDRAVVHKECEGD